MLPSPLLLSLRLFEPDTRSFGLIPRNELDASSLECQLKLPKNLGRPSDFGGSFKPFGFFIEQAMLYPDADSYRVLGASPKANSSELRRHMSLLLRWLHPDRGLSERSVFAHRVTRAWNDLKNEERRAAYDRRRASALAEKSLERKRRRTSPKAQLSHRRTRLIGAHVIPVLAARGNQSSGLLRKILLFLLGREVT